MAARTSSQSGNWNDTATWGGAAAPGDGDTAVITSGHTVTVTANATVGSNSSNVGNAITINGTNSTTFGKLVVNDGVTLTLKGNDNGSNKAMSIARYAVFEPQPGAIIEVDSTSDYETTIVNSGIINAIGTLAKPITFRGTAASANWNNSQGPTTLSGASHEYNGEANLSIRRHGGWISNAAGTGLGSLGDSSLTISSQSPASICTTEVAIGPPDNPAVNVTSTGKYAVDYHTGCIYFYHSHSFGNPSFSVSYKNCSFNGWGIVSIQDTTYNEAKFDYCYFRYLGGAGVRLYGIENRYKKSTAVEANRRFQFTNCVVDQCKQFLALRDITGSAADRIQVTGNRFNHTGGNTFAQTIGINESAACSYIDFNNNVLDTSGFLLIGSPFDTTAQHVGIRINGNTGTCQAFLSQRGTSIFSELYDGEIANNAILGMGRTGDGRMFNELMGSSGHPLVMRDNMFALGNRFISGLQSYFTMYGNIADSFPHHWITMVVADDVYSTDWNIYNNLFFCRNAVDPDGILETAYNHRGHLNNVTFANNTIGRGCYCMLSLGDTNDTNSSSLVTNLVVANNICYQPTYAIRRNSHDSDELNLHHILYLDNNLCYNPSGGQTSNYNKQATFIKSGTAYNLDGTRNVLGVALFDPLYTLPEATGRSLVFTYTSATDQTLAWGGGSAVQLVVSSGTATGVANASNNQNSTLTDSGKSWSTNLVSGTVVRNKWVKITSGTGAGQIRAITNNTATVLTVTPKWTTLPTGADYAIIESEVQLFDSGATNYVRAGVYLPSLPTSSQSDSGITITASNLTTDPLLANATGNTAADYKVSGSSPVIGAAYATYAPSLDYFGTTRSSPDMGFYEYVSTGGNSYTSPGIGIGIGMGIGR